MRKISSYLFPNFILGLFLFVLVFLFSCESRPSVVSKSSNSDFTEEKTYTTEYVIIIVIDGPRYSETWGDSTHRYIPRLSQLAPEGIIFTNFHNNGPTYTNAGYTAITTGNYEEISNSGMQFPENPSLFQYYLQKSGKERNKAWIFQSKGKLKILSDCLRSDWEGKFIPSFICGMDGGYSEDKKTLDLALETLKEQHPHLAMIGFKEPDHSGHLNDWEGYREGIKKTDEYVFLLWEFLHSDPVYKNKTSIFITNDHGRHSDGVSGGFSEHGDQCEGCRHINLFVAGPDFEQNKIISSAYELIDIPATIAELLGFEMTSGKGRVIREGFR